MSRLIHKFLILFVVSTSVLSQDSKLSLDPVSESINAVRFDPSYYYNAPVRANVLAEQLAKQWQSNGVNTVFYKAYDPIYGAKYKTNYELNSEADYGRQNLLKYVLAACSEQGIRVMAWIPAFQHKNAWEKHPQWRVKNPDGSDYRLNETSYPLCAANPEVRNWWLGFIRDLLQNYPGLAGIDIGEPVVRWQSAYCSCASCSRQIVENGWQDASALGLNKTLLASFALVHGFHKIACVTSVVSPKPDGELYTPAEQRGYTGFDLDVLLATPDRPDWINLELMWQQWADLYKNPSTFQPAWVKQSAALVKSQVAGRSRLLVHLELTPFGQQNVSDEQLRQSILAAKSANLPDIDLYDTRQIDSRNAWPVVRAAFAWHPIRRALVVSDPLGENDVRQLAGLLSHFQAETKTILLDHAGSYHSGRLADYDLVFYLGVDPKFSIPNNFLQDLAAFKGVISWVHFGIGQFLQQPATLNYGFNYLGSASDSTWHRVRYKSRLLLKQDPDFDKIAVTDSNRCAVLAWMENGKERLPYAVHSDNLWYFSDLTTAFVIEGGSYIVFADLLHDILEQNHRTNPLAMVRIEDISPLSDIVSLRRMADYLHDQQVPFSISLVPFYLDPVSNTAASLSDQPEFVKAIHYLIRKGGVVVMHGNTHQYRGESTSDYEFWDAMQNGPLFSDSREYVRERLETGLAELARNDLYPVTWETPHYGASQLDYSVINQYFSSSYERRQTIDLHGSDQLAPWLLYHHSAGGKIIPENLGYIPLSRPEAGPLLEAAANNLALRDGVASFFFHPFVDMAVLKEIIPQMKQMGYRFTDPRHTSQQVRSRTFRVLTGNGDIELPFNSAYSREFFLDANGKMQQETVSVGLRSDTLRKSVQVPEGWIYVAAAVTEKPKGVLARFFSGLARRVPNVADYVGTTRPLTVADEQPARMVLLVDRDAQDRLARDQSNWEQALATVGLDVQRFYVDQFFTVPDGVNLIVAPYAAARKLNQQQILLLVRTVQNGASLILERASELSAAIGIVPQETFRIVTSITDEYYPTVPIHWSSPDTLTDFDTEFDYITYASDSVSAKPVVIGGEYGDGRYLFWATLFDPDSDGGYGRFPFVLEMLRYQFGIKPLVRRDALDIYFDPGSREDISIEDLIKMWRRNGVRTIQVAGWHSYRDYTYDYGRLIELAHQNAMRVYLWLELPHVSEKFWLDHPEWREQNALVADVDTSRIHWRRPMTLYVAPCREAVMAELRTMLTAFDWDGINLAELYYESAAGVTDRKWFTPMSRAFRTEFSLRNGYDPLTIFNNASNHFWQRDKNALTALYALRQEQIIEQHRQFLQFFKTVEKEKNTSWEIIVTTLDAAMAPAEARNMAVNTEDLAALSAECPFTLQLEEPPGHNPIRPQEYVEMVKRIQNISHNQSAMVTINLVERPNSADLITRQITGLELYRTLQQIHTHGGRFALNSEASLYDVDNGYLPQTLASATQESLATSAWYINAATQVSMLLDAKQHPDVLVDGDLWPAYHRGRLILPAGKHVIEPIRRSSSFLKGFWAEGNLLALSGELLHVERIVRGLRLRYRAQTANWVVLSEKPRRVLVDGKHVQPVVMRGELGYAFALPPGEHDAELYTTDRTIQTIKQISLALSSLIAVGGFVFGLLLGFLFLKNSRLRRRTAKK